MRIVHIGLGQFGFGWFKMLAERKDIELVGVVDLSTEALSQTKEYNFNLYTDAAKAMDEQKPDFIINATPPDIHKLINYEAFKRNIPILSEKPIAISYDDAVEILEYSQNGLKIMIAENYRYFQANRFVKEVLDKKPIGEITDIKMEFRRHHVKTNYHKHLEHPMLLDVGIHHLDMLRYFTETEAKSVYADFHTPSWSWYEGYSNAALFITMMNGTKVRYTGSLDAYDEHTSWYCDWTFTGEKGVLRYKNNEMVYISTDGKVLEVLVPEESVPFREVILDHFMDYLKNDILPETHIADNMKTFEIMNAAFKSFELKKEIDVKV